MTNAPEVTATTTTAAWRRGHAAFAKIVVTVLLALAGQLAAILARTGESAMAFGRRLLWQLKAVKT